MSNTLHCCVCTTKCVHLIRLVFLGLVAAPTYSVVIVCKPENFLAFYGNLIAKINAVKMAQTQAKYKRALAKTYDVKAGTWWIPLNQLSVPPRDTQKSPIAYISKWNCNSPQWCASRVYEWGRVVKLPSPSQILRTASDLLKILSKKFPSSFPSHRFDYEKKEKKKLLNCFEDKGEKFPKYHYVSQSRSTHVVVTVFPVRFIDVVTVWMDIKKKITEP